MSSRSVNSPFMLFINNLFTHSACFRNLNQGILERKIENVVVPLTNVSSDLFINNLNLLGSFKTT